MGDDAETSLTSRGQRGLRRFDLCLPTAPTDCCHRPTADCACYQRVGYAGSPARTSHPATLN